MVMGGTEEETVGKDVAGRGKGKEIQRMEEDTESELDGSDAEHNTEEEKEEDTLPELSDLDWPEEPEEPAIIYYETSDTVWGKAYLEALKQDPDYGDSSIIRKPFFRNPNGFIIKAHAQHKPRVYILKGRVRIGGELYDMRELLIHSTHGRLGHFVTTKTYNDLRRETFWPGQWKQVQHHVASCDICQRTKLPTQKPPGIARILQIPDSPWMLTPSRTADTLLWVKGMIAWRKTGRGSPSHYSRMVTLAMHAA